MLVFTRVADSPVRVYKTDSLEIYEYANLAKVKWILSTGGLPSASYYPLRNCKTLSDPSAVPGLPPGSAPLSRAHIRVHAPPIRTVKCLYPFTQR